MVPGFEWFGKVLVGFGVLMVLLGGLLWIGGRFVGLGRLPGDILIQKGNFTFYFPLLTCIVLSLLLTFLLNLISRR